MRTEFCLRVALGLIAAALASAQTAQRISYGAEDTSFGELTVPQGTGPFPVAVLLHGGCWVSRAGNISEMRPMAAMVAKHGIAAWNVEYRRAGHPGGGWPGTYHDLSLATDFVRELAKSHPLSLSRVVIIGHSSGGYFGAWLAGRSHLPAAK
jgi:acetyl esterase/lipase